MSHPIPTNTAPPPAPRPEGGAVPARTVERVRALEKERGENPESVVDLTGVGWTEVWAMMREDGYRGSIVDGRLDWANLPGDDDDD